MKSKEDYVKSDIVLILIYKKNTTMFLYPPKSAKTFSWSFLFNISKNKLLGYMNNNFQIISNKYFV